MTSREYVISQLQKNQDYGVEGYELKRTLTKFDGPLVTKIHAGKKKTFVDDAIRFKKHVPDANYNVQYDWIAEKHPNFNKDKRHTIATDIQRKAERDSKPEPHTYSPRHQLVEPSLKGAFNFKGKRGDTSFLAEPVFRGHTSPKYHEKNHSLVEKRSTYRKFYKPINEKLDAIPSFLRAKPATQNISPASHNPLDSLKTACMPNKTFFMRKGSPASYVDQEVKRTKGNPGVGQYNLKNINKAYNMITLGAGKGWK